MTKEDTWNLWKESQWDGENPRRIIEEVVEEFAKKIMFEGAKFACVNCRMFGQSVPTNSPGTRYHEIHGNNDPTHIHREYCSASALYF
jgi:hypothetical protein